MHVSRSAPRTRPGRCAARLLAAFACTAGCGGAEHRGGAADVPDVPDVAEVADAPPDDTLVAETTAPVYTLRYDAPAPLDLVFVIDNGGSVIEARVLATALPTFLAALDARAAVAPRIAATSTDAQCEVNHTTIFAARGAFNTVPAVHYPPPDQFEFPAVCTTDADCSAAACARFGACDDPTTDPGTWACQATNNPGCATNPNGTINDTCRRRCTTDVECQALGDPRYICQKPSANQADWGCLLPPATTDCPAVMPTFVEGADLPRAHCLTTMPLNQEKCFLYEQGLEASRLALDPLGPNAAQVAAFRRPDALLAVVFVSNDNDCSAPAILDENQRDACGLLADTNLGGPLAPVSFYADTLRSFTPAGRLVALAVTGFSTASDPAAADAEHAAYVASRTGPHTCFIQTYLCAAGGARTLWGARYQGLAAALGPDGMTANLCAPEQIPATFDAFAARIADHAKRRCLPTANASGLTVTLIRGATETQLAATDDPTVATGYRIVRDALECPSSTAIVPNARVATGDRLVVRPPEAP